MIHVSPKERDGGKPPSSQEEYATAEGGNETYHAHVPHVGMTVIIAGYHPKLRIRIRVLVQWNDIPYNTHAIAPLG